MEEGSKLKSRKDRKKVRELDKFLSLEAEMNLILWLDRLIFVDRGRVSPQELEPK